jgi:hypothetical protein
MKYKTYYIGVLFMISLNLCAQDFSCGRLNEIDGKFYIDESNNLFTGTCISYYEKGIASVLKSYMYGELNGLYEVWYSNGQLMSKGTFLRGVPDGKWVEYDSSGQLIKTGIYNEGELKSGDEISIREPRLRG